MFNRDCWSLGLNKTLAATVVLGYAGADTVQIQVL